MDLKAQKDKRNARMQAKREAINAQVGTEAEQAPQVQAPENKK